MAGRPKYNWASISDDMIREAYAQAGNLVEAGNLLGVPGSALRDHLRHNRPELRAELFDAPAPGVATMAAEREATAPEIAKVFRDHKVDPNSVIVVGSKYKTWNAMTSDKAEGDNRVVEMHGVTVDTRPLDELILPARADGWRAPKIPKAKPNGEGLWVITSDHHIPFHDERLHAATLAWLEEFHPDHGVLLGDLVDMDQVSRHRRTPEATAGVKETITTAYHVLRDYVTTSPGTRWKAIAGNHEDRLRNAVLDQLPALFDVQRECDRWPLLSTPFILRMDELGIEWMDAGGDYNGGQVVLGPRLVARHGWVAKKGGGASARSTVEALRASVIIGHVHRQAITNVTEHDPVTGEHVNLLGVEVGAMAAVGGRDKLASYIPSRAPDWQAGFATVSVDADGDATGELARWDGRTLKYRDWRCTP